jgi:hypothetical protein
MFVIYWVTPIGKRKIAEEKDYGKAFSRAKQLSRGWVNCYTLLEDDKGEITKRFQYGKELPPPQALSIRDHRC